MWIFTKYGFFSAVCALQGDGKHVQPLDKNRFKVRARVRDHLEALKARFPDLLGSHEIQDKGGTDYPFRIIIDKPAWTQILSALSDEIDYGNFKSEVLRHQGKKGAGYEHALHEVWATMNRLQK